ncbi:MAG: hypothetical protein M5U28_22090 [Sandaracinaceae bacterium]|nr:hypothetical protein [Sandaracinaceae bacterium]
MDARGRRWVARAAAIASGLGLVLLGGTYLSERWRGEGHLFVVAPAGAAVTVRLDEREPRRVPAGERLACPMSQGTHVVRVEREDGTRVDRLVRVDRGGQRWVVPAGDDQCFLELDVSESAYGAGGAPTLLRRRGATPSRSAARRASRGASCPRGEPTARRCCSSTRWLATTSRSATTL